MPTLEFCHECSCWTGRIIGDDDSKFCPRCGGGPFCDDCLDEHCYQGCEGEDLQYGENID